MAHSLQVGATQPGGHIEHKLSASSIAITNKHGQQLHQLEAKGLKASYPVAYSVGAGKVGYSYLIALGPYLFQSPASYYSQTKMWDLTPGYESESRLDFTHRITAGCVFCHSGQANLAQDSENRFVKPELSPISCERCHGSSQNHLANPVPGSIVNPAKLDIPRRNAICEQCHLEGEVRILNPGKQWRSFQPGQLLEDTFVTYIARRDSGEGLKAVSQAEQLALSRCARESGGALWCGTCHNPHSVSKDRPADIKAVCLTCHAQVVSTKRHQSVQECTSCHMPRLRPTNVAHAAITDHLIARPDRDGLQTKSVVDGTATQNLIAWREPAGQTTGQLAERDRALALFQRGMALHDPAEIQRAYEMLAHLPARDPEVLATLGSILLANHYRAKAVDLLRQAVEQKPQNARYAFLLGSALDADGKNQAAVQELRNSIEEDPASPDAYRKLIDIYERAGMHDMAQEIADEYRKVMPQNFEFREKQ